MVKRKARALTKTTRQTGKSDMSRDRKRKALAPGPRISKSGKKYTEYRKNRSDVKGRDTPITKRKKLLRGLRANSMMGDRVVKRVKNKSNWNVLTKTPKMLRFTHPTKGTLELFGENINGKNRYYVSLVNKNAIADKEFRTKKLALDFAKKLMDGKIKPKTRPKISKTKMLKVKTNFKSPVLSGITHRLVAQEPFRGARRHALLPQSIRNKLPKLYATDGKKDKMIYLKLFSPYSGYTLYVAEFDGKDTFFGYVKGRGSDEWGYSSYSELARANRGGLPLIERDMYFKPKKFSQIRK